MPTSGRSKASLLERQSVTTDAPFQLQINDINKRLERYVLEEHYFSGDTRLIGRVDRQNVIDGFTLEPTSPFIELVAAASANSSAEAAVRQGSIGQSVIIENIGPGTVTFHHGAKTQLYGDTDKVLGVWDTLALRWDGQWWVQYGGVGGVAGTGGGGGTQDVLWVGAEAPADPIIELWADTDEVPVGDGPPGPQGPEGPAGPTGPQGPTGPAGPEGAQGVQGPQGVVGPVGPTGSTGATGPGGPQGPQGPAGTGINLKGEVPTVGDLPTDAVPGDAYIVAADGNLYQWNGTVWIDAGQIVGPEGPIGSTGATGPEGPQGPIGPTGSEGPQGIQGPVGPTGADSVVPGPEGPVGPPGAQGVPGADSTVPGPAGPQGPQGATGATGPASTVPGPAGPTGPEGPQGPQGLTGNTGATGATGATGSTGPAGPGVPAGGAVDTILTKSGTADYATVWDNTLNIASVYASGTVDANYLQSRSSITMATGSWLYGGSLALISGLNATQVYIGGAPATQIVLNLPVHAVSSIYAVGGISTATGVHITSGAYFMMPQGSYLRSGTKDLITFDGTFTVINGTTWHNGRLHITTNAYVTTDLDVGSLNSRGQIVIASYTDLKTSAGYTIAHEAAGTFYMVRQGNANFNDLGGASYFIGGLQSSNNMTINTDKIFQGSNGSWISYVRASGVILYAYNADCNFNEGSGGTTFIRNVSINGQLTLAKHYWLYGSNGAQIAGAWDAGFLVYFAHNANAQFNTDGGETVFARKVVANGDLFVTATLYKTGYGAYTYPDYVFEHAYTGRIEQFSEAPGAADYGGLLPLADVEAYTREHWRLPDAAPREEGRVDVFRRTSDTLAEVEKLYLYLFEHQHRQAALEARLTALEARLA